MTSTPPLILDLREADRTLVGLVGGKAAQLGELTTIDGIRVPRGFCVTTLGFRRIKDPSIEALLDQLSGLHPDDRDALRAVSAEVRQRIESAALPDDLVAAVTEQLDRLGQQSAYAVRSSATAEDMPNASFAGQQNTYLNVVGAAAILRHVSRCWASLFTERAVTYRSRTGLDHRQVDMAVIIQRMVIPHAAGVVFTADPITSNRKVAAVEAVFGLGDALVSGRVNADSYKVRGGEIVERTVATKRLAVVASASGGTHEDALDPAQQDQPVLTDAQVTQLVELGRRIEAHFGAPQDIEWCLDDGGFHMVQSRPITTLFPIPAAEDDANHVYLSVGHQQMMTDAMKPLGLSVWLHTTPAPMSVAGGRLFIDVSTHLASPARRAGLLEAMGKSDPLMRDALETVLGRGDFIPLQPDAGPASPPAAVEAATDPIDPDPTLVEELIGRAEASLADLRRDIRSKSGTALLEFVRADLEQLFGTVFDARTRQVVMTGIEAMWWLNDQLAAWLGEKNAADTLAQSVPHNVTSAMGLALLDVADAIRPHPAVVDFLATVEGDGFLDELAQIPGGEDARAAILDYLDKYGMRCVGEIDITRPRWRERPSALVPVIVGHLHNFEPGEAARRFEQGQQAAAAKEEELVRRVRALPDGEQKAAETKKMIDRVRAFSGFREYPKYGIVGRYFVHKQALLEEAARLVENRVLADTEDIFYLTLPELTEVVRTNRADADQIRRRREEFESYRALTAPRVLTSDGEGLSGRYRRDDLPTGALVGLPVSSGTVEGRARVIRDMAQADLEPGDILVTAYTDPSWTPLFVVVAGLVTEVGGLMTHGAVIAREYGLPAVVGVEHATELLADGQRIRVHGTDGYVEILS